MARTSRATSAIRNLVKQVVNGRPPPTPIERGLLTMGRHSYGMPKVHHYEGDPAVVRVGHFTSIALDVEFLPGGNHHRDRVTTFPMHRLVKFADSESYAVASRGDVIVGNDVWIGRGARVVGGLTIGDGAIVAAYSVVTKSVAPYTLVAGAPAVPKRRRFPDHVCEALLSIAWWDWPDEMIISRAQGLMSADIEAFIAKYRRPRNLGAEQ